MGSFVELNDTLQITKEQGFPQELDLEKHLQTPLTAEQFKDTVFEFQNKPGVRLYHLPPVRNFFAENRDGKWIYWGLVHILETRCDYVNKTTSGKFKLIYIYTPEEMKKVHDIMDRREETRYFD
ncbi:MAG TPA: hypothetical protein VLF93_05280 [Candidatus Saccharimonadales bacterium]|nr:hypothetical protein [Candidatus Saccharimonadales bacterium]